MADASFTKPCATRWHLTNRINRLNRSPSPLSGRNSRSNPRHRKHPDLPTSPLNRSRWRVANQIGGVGLLTIFVLAVFVGFEVVSKVSSTLHTPLMSGA